jgi:hypothetical protein
MGKRFDGKGKAFLMNSNGKHGLDDGLSPKMDFLRFLLSRG